VAKLHGLDAPQRIEASGPSGGPIETEEKPDYSGLSLNELLQLEELQKKALGLPEPCIDEGPYTRKWYAAQRAAETQPAMTKTVRRPNTCPCFVKLRWCSVQ
jgi:hypothetical protein